MSLKDLSKEQKQYVALGLLATAILVILMALGFRFSMATVSAAKEELDDLSAKISTANKQLSRSRQTSEEYVETAAVLRNYLTNAPPERNYYSWATEVIYSKGRLAGLEIDSIDEISIPHARRSVSDDVAAAISFESYSLRIMAHGGYENTKYFINILKQDYPLVRFSGVEISSGQNPDAHDVQFFMQWPFNFGEITRNWDAIASTQLKMAESNNDQEVAPLKEPESASSVTSIARPDPTGEPHPPTTRPAVEETPSPKPEITQTAPKTQPKMDADMQIESSSDDAVPKPATDDEIQTLLSGVVPQDAERMAAEPQRAITAPDPIVKPEPVAESKIVDSEPIPVVEPHIKNESIAKPDPEPAVEQEIPELINEFEVPDSVPMLKEPEADAIEAAPQIVSSSLSKVDSAPTSPGGPQTASISEVSRNYVSTGKSEKILKELLNKGSTRQDATLSSFLDGLVGEINEK